MGNKENKKKKSGGAIGYSATITVSVERNNKIISTKTYHNNGHEPLFYFLAKCIVNRYSEVTSYTPKFIQFFSAASAGTPYTGVDISTMFDESTVCSPKRVYSGTPITDSLYNSATGEDYATVDFEFFIPFSYLNTTGGDVNLIALYCQEYYDEEYLQEPSCYFPITAINGETGVEEWSTLAPSTAEDKNKSNLLIRWQMKIENIG